MQFFKHFADARTRTGMQLLMDEMGLVGYAAYFILIELCTAKWDMREDDWEQCKFRFSWSQLRREFRMTQAGVERWLGHGQVYAGVNWTDNGSHLEIYLPNLLKFFDKYTKYNRKRVVSRSLSGGLDKEEEEDKEKETITAKSFGQTTATRPPIDFLEAYRRYPRKEKKQRGLQIVKRDVKSEADFQKLLEAISRYTGHIEKNHIERKYIKQFSTFMAEWKEWLEPETGTVVGLKEDNSMEALMQELDRKERERSTKGEK